MKSLVVYLLALMGLMALEGCMVVPAYEPVYRPGPIILAPGHGGGHYHHY